MTKKEQAAFAQLQQDLRIAQAFRFTPTVEPDVTPPEKYKDIKNGWSMHTWGDDYRVEPAWTSRDSHGTGQPSRRADGWIMNGSQGSRWLYSSEILALKAARHDMEKRYARVLAQIDEQIEKLSERRTGDSTRAGSAVAQS